MVKKHVRSIISKLADSVKRSRLTIVEDDEAKNVVTIVQKNGDVIKYRINKPNKKVK